MVPSFQVSQVESILTVWKGLPTISRSKLAWAMQAPDLDFVQSLSLASVQGSSPAWTASHASALAENQADNKVLRAAANFAGAQASPLAASANFCSEARRSLYCSATSTANRLR